MLGHRRPPKATLASPQGGVHRTPRRRRPGRAARVAGRQAPQRPGDPLRPAHDRRPALGALQRRSRGHALVLRSARRSLRAPLPRTDGRRATAHCGGHRERGSRAGTLPRCMTATVPAPRILLGRIDALELALAADVAERQREDPLRPVVVLVGETLLRAYLRRRLAEINGPYLNVYIVTSGELALRLGEIPLILAGQKPLPLLADRMLAQEAALSTSTYFDAVAGTPGFGQALHRTLVEIRRSGITADELSNAAPASLESKKLSALA